jgi:TPR repeat protein
MYLGTMYWNGDGVPRDHAQAAKIWHVSAEHGNTSAPAAARADSGKLVDLLLNAAPGLKPNVEKMLGTPKPPSF